MRLEGFKSAFIHPWGSVTGSKVQGRSISAVRKDGATAVPTYSILIIHVLVMDWFVLSLGEEIDKYTEVQVKQVKPGIFI